MNALYKISPGRWICASEGAARLLLAFFAFVYPFHCDGESVANPTAIRLEQRLGNAVPLDLRFTDSTGQSRALGDFFGNRPVVLAMGYHQCPNLCGIVLNATSNALAALTLHPSEDYDFIFVSIDPNETPALAASNKKAYARHYGKSGTDRGWHFLTGDARNIDALAAAIGFEYRYDEQIGQFAHPSGILVLTPEARISKYLYGIEYNPRTLRLALVEASHGEVGSAVDQLLLLCFHYNPITGKYSLTIDRTIKAAGTLSVLALGFFVGSMVLRERRERKAGLR